MRVVLDTNILISACWTPGGNEARVLALVLQDQLTAAVSDAVSSEYHDVASRKKFASRQSCLLETLGALLAKAVRVTPDRECDVCADPDDNRLLECADAAGARFVVTGNLKDFPESWQGIRAVNARTLLDSL